MHWSLRVIELCNRACMGSDGEPLCNCLVRQLKRHQFVLKSHLCVTIYDCVYACIILLFILKYAAGMYTVGEKKRNFKTTTADVTVNS